MYTGISEVVNKSNIDMLIGALMKNQQGQHQLNLMSINIFKEMSCVFWYGLLAFKGLSLLKKLQNIKEDILLTIRLGTHLTCLHCVNSTSTGCILPLLNLHGTFCFMN